MRRELESAFRRARYRVLSSSGELLLRVDESDAALAALLRASGANCASLLTAFNPCGRRQAPFRNRRAQKRLHDALTRAGHVVLLGRNEDPRGLWPVESSVFVFDLPQEDAQRIAARYQQAAFLYVEVNGTPRLIETAAQPGSRFSPSYSVPMPRRCRPIQPTA